MVHVSDVEKRTIFWTSVQLDNKQGNNSNNNKDLQNEFCKDLSSNCKLVCKRLQEKEKKIIIHMYMIQSRLRMNIQNMIVEELGDDPSALEAFMDQVEEEGFL